jgi:acyl-coenzyme A thioesterase PaaI-like protein
MADYPPEDRVAFNHDPDPDHPGWLNWELYDDRRFNGQVMGKMNVRAEPDGRTRVRMYPELKHTNLLDIVHGATTLALIDISIFACGHVNGLEGMAGSVTLDLSTQFIGAGLPGKPLDSVVELLRETKRLVFVRGVVEQDDDMVAAFSATIRKARRA